MGYGNIKFKVCGMRDETNIYKLESLFPDYIGFIFYDKSPRYVGDNFKVPDKLKSSIMRVGVFVNETVEIIGEVVTRNGLHLVQLHGDEKPDTCEKIKEYGVRVIKTFSIDDNFDFSVLEFYEGVVDYFLFDTKGKWRGGSGKSFNWKVLNRYNQKIPFFLSGGVGIDTLSGIEALRDMNIYSLDVNSKVEKSYGIKDIEAVKKVKYQLEQLCSSM